ncbi:MAG: Uma2 family endonuclease, partial [Chloroflexota bacterium]|nr:Uma2 family endonuclease [Chloroflexota bacterium]
FRSPRLPLYAQKLQTWMETERAMRERFYEEMSETQKTEFINGEVIVHSPVRSCHNIVGQNLLHLLGTFVRKHQLGYIGYEKILVTLTRNDYEPDLCYFSAEKAQHFAPHQTKFPAPDFVAEILSPGTEANDRGIKFEDYALHGVREYWIIDPEQEFVEQYFLKGEEGENYELHVKAITGVLESLVITGFIIPVRAIFDEAEQFTALRALLESA